MSIVRYVDNLVSLSRTQSRKAPEMFPDHEQDRPIKYEDFRQ